MKNREKGAIRSGELYERKDEANMGGNPGILVGAIEGTCMAFYLSKEEIGEFAVVVRYGGREMFLPIDKLRFTGTYEEALDAGDKFKIRNPRVVKTMRVREDKIVCQ